MMFWLTWIGNSSGVGALVNHAVTFHHGVDSLNKLAFLNELSNATAANLTLNSVQRFASKDGKVGTKYKYCWSWLLHSSSSIWSGVNAMSWLKNNPFSLEPYHLCGSDPGRLC